MIWLILYLIIAFAIFIALLCLCCVEYKKITNPYHSFENWMSYTGNWNIILYSGFWIVFLVVLIVLTIVFVPINLVLKYFDIKPMGIWS